MTYDEYSKVKTLSYSEYCDYLQEKYGLSNYDYMSRKFTKISKSSRTSEGLYAHHKMEFIAPSLSEPEWASQFPWEFQAKENIVYCDLLEHMYLHLLIAEECEDKMKFLLGFGGIIDFFVPELNDLYSGWETKQKWRATCHSKIKDNKDVYLALIERLMIWWRNMSLSEDKKLFNLKFDTGILKSSLGDRYGSWSSAANRKIYAEISSMTERLLCGGHI